MGGVGWGESVHSGVQSNTENLPTFTHAVEMTQQLWADSSEGVEALGSIRLKDVPLFTLRFCSLCILSCYVSMIYKRTQPKPFHVVFPLCFDLLFVVYGVASNNNNGISFPTYSSGLFPSCLFILISFLD